MRIDVLPSDSTLLLLSLTSLFFGVIFLRVFVHQKKLPLPPGPKPLPIIGNALQIAGAKYQWFAFAQWAKEYGDIIHLNALGQHIIVLNSVKVVSELLEGRSSTYSDRPVLPMLGELVGWRKWAFAFMNYGDTWRQQRRMFQQHFSPTASTGHQKVELYEMHRTLRRLLTNPSDFRNQMKYFTASVIIHVVYGIETQEADDPYIALANAAGDASVTSGIPGTFHVDVLPLMRFLPSWMPGGAFKTIAHQWRQAAGDLNRIPFDAAKHAIGTGSSSSSVVARMLEEDDKSSQYETAVQNVAAVASIGGTDPTTSALQTFFLAMSMYPDAQRRAQAELDAVVGKDRLPNFDDRPLLPYIEAIVKEVLRWQPVLPLAIVHAVNVEDEYMGYRIPKGAMVMPNSWSILHDESNYPDPNSFNPERFLKDGRIDPNVFDPTRAAFGYGRRICPGRYTASDVIFITVASVLATFSIQPAKDDKGQQIPIQAVMSPGMLSYPEEFKCSIRPRSEGVPGLIQNALDASE